MIGDFTVVLLVAASLFSLQFGFFAMLFSLIEMQSVQSSLTQMLQSFSGDFSPKTSVQAVQLSFLATNALAMVLLTVHFVSETIKCDYSSRVIVGRLQMMSILRVDGKWGGLVSTPSIVSPLTFFIITPLQLLKPELVT
jgi:hypothetical protein